MGPPSGTGGWLVAVGELTGGLVVVVSGGGSMRAVVDDWVSVVKTIDSVVVDVDSTVESDAFDEQATNATAKPMTSNVPTDGTRPISRGYVSNIEAQTKSRSTRIRWNSRAMGTIRSSGK
jgi:hypothetical protein